MKLELAGCLKEYFQILGVASGNKDEDYELLPGTEVSAFRSNEKPA